MKEIEYFLRGNPLCAGESYAETGSADRSFTGQTQDVLAGPTSIYDFLFRQHSSAQGRWLTPDPAGLAAVDLTNPQTWNRYAYLANNPMNKVDPKGLMHRKIKNSFEGLRATAANNQFLPP